MLGHDEIPVCVGLVVIGRDAQGRAQEHAECGDRGSHLVRVRNAPHDTDRVNKRSQRRDDNQRDALENILDLVIN